MRPSSAVSVRAPLVSPKGLGIGLALPSALRIAPRLTGAAAVGLLVVMVLAAGTHLMNGQASHVPVNVVLGGLSAFVAWGRLSAARIAPRSQVEEGAAALAARPVSGAGGHRAGRAAGGPEARSP